MREEKKLEEKTLHSNSAEKTDLKPENPALGNEARMIALFERKLNAARVEFKQYLIGILKSIDPEYDSRPFLESFDEQEKQTDCGSILNAWCLARASSIAYRSKEIVRWEINRCYKNNEKWQYAFVENTKTNTQLFALSDSHKIILAFRGTQTDRTRDKIKDIQTDIDTVQVPFRGMGKVHRGFSNALDSVWPAVLKILNAFDPKREKKLWITGHSLGGALAMLAFSALHFQHQNENTHWWAENAFLYTFGQPRVGDKTFAGHLSALACKRIYRVVNNKDPVTFVPLLRGYKHVGRRVYINRHGKIQWLKPDESVLKDKIISYVSSLSLSAFFIAVSRIFPFISLPTSLLIEDHDKYSYVLNINVCREKFLKMKNHDKRRD
jgi:triacylglycerol lipase